MRWKQIIEAPVADLATVGDLNSPGTFRPEDLKKFRDPEWHVRVRRVLERCPVVLNLCFVNGDEQKRVKRSGATWIDRIYPHDLEKSKNGSQSYIGINSALWAKSVLGDQLPKGYEQAVNVLLFHNEGTNRVGLTPWIVAHRIGHAFYEDTQREVMRPSMEMGREADKVVRDLVNTMNRAGALKELPLTASAYDIVLTVAKMVSPFRTARNGNLTTAGEWVIELFAQFMTSGAVTFIRPEVEDRAALERWLSRAEKDLNEIFLRTLKMGEGKFVCL